MLIFELDTLVFGLFGTDLRNVKACAASLQLVTSLNFCILLVLILFLLVKDVSSIFPRLLEREG